MYPQRENAYEEWRLYVKRIGGQDVGRKAEDLEGKNVKGQRNTKWRHREELEPESDMWKNSIIPMER